MHVTPTLNWRAAAGATFSCEKAPAAASRGMAIANHPLASAAGAEMMAAGGNAVDAAVAALFTLSVVEPMMVGVLGGGMTHIRSPDGVHTVLDGLSRAPLAAAPDMYTPLSDTLPDYLETVGRANAIGPRAVASGGNLPAWCEALRRCGRLSLADVMEPAIRHARRGFQVTPYLSECITENAADLSLDSAIAGLLLPAGRPAPPGSRLLWGEHADSLALIAKEGEGVLHGGELGALVCDAIERGGGTLRLADLSRYQVQEREPVRGSYRGFEVVGPPPPASSGVHLVQMLNVLEGFDLRAMGFGSAASVHLLLEVLKMAFADRAAVSGDPDFVDVPVDTLIDKAYADSRRKTLHPGLATAWSSGLILPESPNTTHVTTADADGAVVSATHTLNNTFGARFLIPGAGLIANNNMHLFDPHPGRALSIVPGKRVTTSQSPVMVLRDGQVRLALGLPGGLRIFGSVMQSLVNLIDHGMGLQEAVEAPRVWSQGGQCEVEAGIPDAVRDRLTALGHDVLVVPHVAGGMNAVLMDDDGTLHGAACWRADGTPVGVSGGLARAGARFWPDAPAPGSQGLR